MRAEKMLIDILNNERVLWHIASFSAEKVLMRSFKHFDVYRDKKRKFFTLNFCVKWKLVSDDKNILKCQQSSEKIFTDAVSVELVLSFRL